MKNTIFTGAGVAIITPMNADGSINFDELGRLIDFNIDNGTDAIIICGTTGESATMTDDEHIECIRYAVEKKPIREFLLLQEQAQIILNMQSIFPKSRRAWCRRPAGSYALLQ